MIRFVRPVLFALAIVALTASRFVGGCAWGQTSKGALAGTVRDGSGAVVARARVTATSEETGETRSEQSSGLGAYRIEAVNPGRYEIRVEMPGFRVLDVREIVVTPSVVTSYNPVLAVGDVQTVVNVTANSNAIGTVGGQLSGTVDSLELSQVPIFSLNPFELVATLPGVQLINPALNLLNTAGAYEQLSANGARPRSNNYMLDGQDINDVGVGGQSINPVVPEMYQSTTALLNSSSAEYGRSGGMVVNLVTKSGTNKIHGSAWELYSGSGLNALDGVTRKGKETPPYTPGYVPPSKARYDQHQFGFTLGGPLWKNRLFGFGGVQFSRFYGNAASTSVELPNAAGYAELSAIAGVSATAAAQVALLQGLLNNGSYLKSYSIVGSSRSLPVSAANCPGHTACSVATSLFQRPPAPEQQPDTQWMYRLDYIPRESDTLAFRYWHDRQNFAPELSLNTSGLPGFDAQAGGPAELGIGTWTHVFTPHLVNELRGSEVRLSLLFEPTDETKANPESTVFNVALSGTGLPTLGISQNIPQGRSQELYQVQDTLSWTVGRQSIRLGADVGRDLETDLIAQTPLGLLDIATGGGASALDNFLANRLGTSGYAYKSFGDTRIDPHLWKLAGFIQDDIKVTSSLTVNLGLRYDYMTNPENVLQYPAVDVYNPFTSIKTVTPVKADKNNFGPRFGFAYQPHGGWFADGKTVIHGGIGVFYDTDFTNMVINGAQSAPNVVSNTATSSAPGGLTNATGQLALLSPVISEQSSVTSVASNMVNPLTYQYNLGFERELPAAVRLEVNYVGARGEKLFTNRQLNYLQGPGLGRINSSRGVINIHDNRADSNYNSVQVEVSRRFEHGLFFRASYAYGKNLDDSSEVFTTFGAPTAYSANLAGNALGEDWGNSIFDRRHVASFEYVYSPVGLRSANRGMDMVLGAVTRHWLISGTTQFSTGPYSTYNFSGIDSNGDGSATNDRPLVSNRSKPVTAVGIDGEDLLEVGVPGVTPGVYYDLAAFNGPDEALVPVAADQERFLIPGGPTAQRGIGRNSFENPGQSFWNLALEKDVPLAVRAMEGARLVFRGECQNVGNHNNVSVLDINLLDVGTSSFQNTANAREATHQSFRVWAKFVF